MIIKNDDQFTEKMVKAYDYYFHILHARPGYTMLDLTPIEHKQRLFMDGKPVTAGDLKTNHEYEVKIIDNRLTIIKDLGVKNE